MFCIYCGEELKEEGRFCPNCGKPVDPNTYREPSSDRKSSPEKEEQQSGGTQQSSGTQQSTCRQQDAGLQMNMNEWQDTGAAYGSGMPGGTAVKKGVSPAVAAAVIAVVLVSIAGSFFTIYWNFFRDSYKTPIENMIKVVEEQDMNAASELIPEQYLTAVQSLSGIGANEVVQMLQERLVGDFGNYIGDINVDYEIMNVRDLTSSELQNLEESYLGYMSGIEEGKEVGFTYELYVDDELQTQGEAVVRVIKVDGKWYLNPGDL